MTELSGTLDGVGLPAVVRFLSGLQKSGSLHLEQDGWRGELAFNAGTLVHASFGSRTGLPALDGLVEALPRATFVFDSHDAVSAQSNIDLDRDAVLSHLDDVAARGARGQSCLPAADAIPTAITGEASTDEPVQLDRATLQTLLSVNGQRSVREIVQQRGSFDALWHLGRLLEAGLIQLDARPPSTAMPPVSVVSTQPVATPPVEPTVTVPTPILPLQNGQSSAQEDVPSAAEHCPKLGFEDDPDSSFGRPTRLHRCFAAGRPLPLSLDQQRELCLSDQYGTCPRLHSAPSPAQQPRIVRLPIAGRPSSAQPERDMAAGGAPEQRPLLKLNTAARQNTAAAGADPPTPLRARLSRAVSDTAEGPTGAARQDAAPAAVPAAPRPSQPRDAVPVIAMSASEGGRRIGPLPLAAIPGIAVAVIAIAVIVYLLAPQSDSLFGDNTVDPALLPNTSRVEAGTPVADLGLEVQTPVPDRASTVSVEGARATAEPSANEAPTANPAPAQPTSAAPTVAATPAAPAQSTAPLFDERFTTNDAGWPSNPVGAALITNGTYRIVTRQAGQFAAVSAPVADVPSDVVVSATFRKLAGPPGGGYGIILRDQQTGLRDGTSQDGQYYVLEAGDKGEIGIWRRDGDHWVDLLPWQHSDAVKTDEGTNELVARAVGNTLSLSVNGTQVATRTDATLSGGRAGLFVGGDGNQVAVSRFTIQTP